MKTMKRFMIYAVAACMAGGSFVACTPEEDDLFSQSSAERLNATIPQYTDLLCSAPNGWVMEYFVNNDWEPGYTYLMKFGKDTSVKMAADNVWIGGKYTESTSVFQVITDDGPVLTFNTYNPIFHFFAAPDNVIGNGAPTDPDKPSSDLDESGYGHRGDYEFVVMNATENLITLRGKKWGQTILMRRMAENVNWEDYLTALAEKKNNLFPKNALDMRMVAGSEVYVVTNMQSGVMSFYPEGGDALTETKKVPYIVSMDGIRMVKPFKGKEDKSDFAVQSFRIDEQNGQFVCTDAGQNATIRNYEPLKWILDTKTNWMIDSENLGGQFAVAYQAFADGVKNNKRPQFGTLRGLELKYDTKQNTYVLNINTSRGSAALYDKLTADENGRVTFEFSGEGEKNAMLICQNVAAANDFVDLLQSTAYILSYPDLLKSTYVKFTSINNAEDYFYVSLNK